MPFVSVALCVFAPAGIIVQLTPPVPTETWFTIGGKPIVVTGDVGSWTNILTSGPSVVVGTSHWKVNGKPMCKLAIDTAPPLLMLVLTGQGPEFFSA